MRRRQDLSLSVDVSILTILQYSGAFSKSAHGAAISALAVHDNLIVTGGSDALVKIWQASPNEPGTYIRSNSRAHTTLNSLS